MIQHWHLVDNRAAVRLLASHKYGAGRLIGHHVCDVNYTVAVPDQIFVLERFFDISLLHGLKSRIYSIKHIMLLIITMYF